MTDTKVREPLDSFVRKLLKGNNYMKYISDKLFCHPIFLEKYSFSKFEEIEKKPSDFQYCLLLMQKVHFGFLVFKNYYPFFSFSYTYSNKDDISLINESDKDLLKYKEEMKNFRKKNSFITIPDVNYYYMYKRYNLLCLKKKTIKKKSIKKISLKSQIKNKTKLFIKKIDMPQIILSSTFTKNQVQFIMDLISGRPVYNIRAYDYNYNGVFLEGSFETLTKINQTVKKKIYVNCYDLAFQFLKRGKGKAKRKYKRHTNSYTLQIALKNLYDKIKS